ncbi:MAG: c-type cytochrome [Anaerolineae bacterium]|nr:c-type cytochrome [Anaerolineae bacterium]
MRRLPPIVPIGLLSLLGGVLLVIGVLLTGAQPAQTQEAPAALMALLGGQTTVHDITPNAFGQPAPGLEREQNLLFFVGNSFFNQNWVIAPSSTTARDGLGPLFISRSCAGCHFKDGRGRAPNFDGEQSSGFLIRLSIPERDLTGANLPDPNYGGQFEPEGIEGVPGEGQVHIVYTDIPMTFNDGRVVTLRQPEYTFSGLNYGPMSAETMISPRVANQMIGLGLLEAVPEADILALADPTDADGDGISGRPNYAWDTFEGRLALGRFGWKANQPTLLSQIAGAFNGDIGVTTSVMPNQNCTAVQIDCRAAPGGGEPELSDDDLRKVVLYSSVLAVPAQRTPDDPQVQRGAQVFEEADCQSCHTITLTTGIHPVVPQLSNQTIHPYTDLLLHDMGDDLADGRPDFQATGNEWRTPPLWGIGLFETVNEHTTYMHDGRARNLLEAILWHGGEAEASRDAVLDMNEGDIDALLAFLASL